MTKIVVATLRNVRVTTTLGADPMLRPRNQRMIDFQIIRAKLLLTILRWNALPHFASCLTISRANGK
jgi:hypothetical protein